MRGEDTAHIMEAGEAVWAAEARAARKAARKAKCKAWKLEGKVEDSPKRKRLELALTMRVVQQH